MLKGINSVIEKQGGYYVVLKRGGNGKADLPIAGILFDKSISKLRADMGGVIRVMRRFTKLSVTFAKVGIGHTEKGL
ncbi:MAG: Adenine deaminase [Firmicutes bacterium]|nr:Adenine deaminase [Bacillota bacterium]